VAHKHRHILKPEVDMNYKTPFTNWSNANSNNSFATPSPPGCSTGESGFLTTEGILSCDLRYKTVGFTKFNIEVYIYLMQNAPHIGCLGISQHDKFYISCCLVVMKLILSRSV
jgi:hypothetical protein